MLGLAGGRGLTVMLLVAACAIQSAAAQEGPFQIVWVVIGEASSASDKDPAHAGRQLFMASDLVSKSLANVRVEQVEVAPVINELAVGQRLCLAKMSIRTLGPGKELVGGAPLSISVRQDHKPRLGSEPEQTRYLFAADRARRISGAPHQYVTGA